MSITISDDELPLGSGPHGLLTRQEMADACHVTLSSINQKHARGELSYIKLFNRVYFPRDEPRRLLEAGFHPAVRQSKRRRD